MTDPHYSSVELFTGAGGLALGVASAGFHHHLLLEYNRDACKTLRLNHEAFGGAANKSALSSYELRDDDALKLISGSVGTQQTAACWVVVTRDNRYAYTTNTGSGTVSGYRVARNGSLSLLNADGRTAVIGAGTAPTDAALTGNSRFLYVLNSAIGSVSGFRVEPNGSLWPVNSVGGLPVGATGLVAP